MFGLCAYLDRSNLSVTLYDLRTTQILMALGQHCINFHISCYWLCLFKYFGGVFAQRCDPENSHSDSAIGRLRPFLSVTSRRGVR